MTPHPKSWARQAIRAGLGAILPRKVFLTRGPKRSGAVCLTFDDGPHPEHTPALLDLLASLRVPATFFLVGREAERYPDLARRMVAEGHAVGSHTYSHPLRKLITASQSADEVTRGAGAVARVVGRRPALYRPPNGKLAVRDLVWLWRKGFTIALWNVDPKDYTRKSADQLRTWFADRALAGGDVVLLHDVHPYATEVLPEVVAAARARGLEFTTLADWTTG